MTELVKHTPGPWTIATRTYSRDKLALEGTVPVIQTDGLCNLVVVSYGATVDEQIKLTNFVAAAPDLLAALHALHNTSLAYESAPQRTKDAAREQLNKAQKAARAAIAKAEGK